MRLIRVDITNFRSIKSVSIDFDPPCRILVGINESGKSNIIRALSFLLKDEKPERNDLREQLPDEEPISTAEVKFVFNFEDKDRKEVAERIRLKLCSIDKNAAVANKDGSDIDIATLVGTRQHVIYHVDVISLEKGAQYHELGSKYKLVEAWKKPSAKCPDDFTFEHNGKAIRLKDLKLVRASDFPSIPGENIEDADISDLEECVGEAEGELAITKLPQTILWKYDDKYLLPNSISLSSFAENPEVCVPLKNMFVLAGIQNIKQSIEDLSGRSQNQVQNFLDHIAHKTTLHFRQVWQEYKTIEFSLKANADQIVPGIKEINTLDFSRRSDGFKRFVTFLLMISSNVKANILTNSLLLIDEPEISLHPSGARYLRDELIRIAEKNNVIFSTHSIFMIDAAHIDRHYIVKKVNEITSIETAGDSNIADEEVLYNALGHSVFAILKAKNIIFEGWNDKKLFRTALEKASTKAKKAAEKIGICHAVGVKTIKAITPLIELADRGCVILSDSDTAAIEKRREYEKLKGYGDWKFYKEIDETIEAVTGEDFISNEYLNNCINQVVVNHNLPQFEARLLPLTAGKLGAVKAWLGQNNVAASKQKEIVDEIKQAVFGSLSPKDIEESYKLLLDGIVNLLAT